MSYHYMVDIRISSINSNMYIEHITDWCNNNINSNYLIRSDLFKNYPDENITIQRIYLESKDDVNRVIDNFIIWHGVVEK